MTPAGILDTFAALMLAVAVVSAARLVAVRPWGRGSVITDIDVAHLLMAIAMAGMVAPALTTLPDIAWEIIFGLLTAWFAYQVVQDTAANGVLCCAPHLVHSAAMLYMFLAVATPAAGDPGTGGMGGPAMRTVGYPTLAFVFALILAGYSIWDLDQLSGRRYSLASARVALVGVTAARAPAMARVQAGSRFSGDSAGADQAVPGGTESAIGSAVCAFLLSPGIAVGCRIVMGIIMALLLLVMI